MGVSGSGKSTVASLLAHRLCCPMLEGDSLHSAENIRRMSHGIALTDADRRGWLEAIAARFAAAAGEPRGLVAACSALKRSYRDILRRDAPRLVFVYLAGDRPLLERRMSGRCNHFMPSTLLDDQLDTLEPPAADERAIACDIATDPAAIVERIVQELPRT